jgi:hypothetical protein
MGGIAGISTEASPATNRRPCQRGIKPSVSAVFTTKVFKCSKQVQDSLSLVLGLGCVAALLERAFDLLCTTAYKPRPGRKAKRPKHQVKPHPKPGYKA